MEYHVLIRGLLIAAIFSYGITTLLLPELINKMKSKNVIGTDVNKPYPRKIPNLGGLAALFGFSLALSLSVGIEKLMGVVYEPPFLAVISVFFIAAMIGLIDDIADMSDRMKVIGLLFASIPLIITRDVIMVIDLPYGYELDMNPYSLFFLFILIPIGITSAANALNMSAGYNGLESGQVVIISLFLLLIAIIMNKSFAAVLIFAALLGCGLALFSYNRYPAKVFVGNIGTMGIGAAIATGVIIGGLEFYGIICIIPAFYEGFATFYYKFIRPVDRRIHCQSPVYLKNGKLKPPKGAEHFTLSFFLLNREAMTEKDLVKRILMFYFVCGVFALMLSIL